MNKKILTIISLLLLSVTNVYAVDNSIYIDQSGDNAVVSVTQDGAGNIVRGIQGSGTSNTTPSRIVGDGNQISVSQVGSGNVLSMGVNTTTAAGAANGGSFTYSVTGNTATAVINSNQGGAGISASNIVSITQSGNTANANINVLGTLNSIVAVTGGGASNSVVSTIDGDNNIQDISMTGGGANTATVSQTGTASTLNLVSVGASNTYTVTQSGGGVVGHSATLDIAGSSNTATITQAGTAADSVVNLKSVGSTNTFTINSNTR